MSSAGSRWPRTRRSRDYLKGITWRERLRAGLHRVFSQVDLLLTPVTAGPPAPIGQERVMHLGEEIEFRELVMSYTVPQDLTGLPACTVRAGFDALGVPTAVQLTGPPWSEWRILPAAHALYEADRGRAGAPAGSRGASDARHPAPPPRGKPPSEAAPRARHISIATECLCACRGADGASAAFHGGMRAPCASALCEDPALPKTTDQGVRSMSSESRNEAGTERFMEKLTWPEVEERIQAGVDAVLLPIGTTEQHGRAHAARHRLRDRPRALRERAAEAAREEGLASSSRPR